MTAALPVLPALNALRTESEFFTAVNTLFETAPPLAKELYSRRNSFATYEQLIDYAGKVIDELKADDQIEVINAHPRIGVKPSTAELSAFSYIEQGLAKEVKSSQEERHKLEQVYEELAKLNAEYEKKFGFKFVVFVNGRTKAEIVPVLRERLKNSRDQELKTGLEAMLLIARDRLKKVKPKSANL